MNACDSSRVAAKWSFVCIISSFNLFKSIGADAGWFHAGSIQLELKLKDELRKLKRISQMLRILFSFHLLFQLRTKHENRQINFNFRLLLGSLQVVSINLLINNNLLTFSRNWNCIEHEIKLGSTCDECEESTCRWAATKVVTFFYFYTFSGLIGSRKF